MPPTDPQFSTLSPIGRALRLLRYISEGGSTLNLTELAKQLEVPRISTVMRLLESLVQEGMIERLANGEHRVGVTWLRMSAQVMADNDLLSLSRRVLENLSQHVGFSAYLSVLDHGEVLYLLREVPNTILVTNLQIGTRLPAHLTAPGRVLLAGLSLQQRIRVLGHDPLIQYTDKSPASHAALNQMIAQDSVEQCAWSWSALENGIYACASPILDRDKKIIAAISVAGVESVFQHDSSLKMVVQSAVITAAQELSGLLLNQSLKQV